MYIELPARILSNTTRKNFILIKYWEDFDMIEYFKGVKKEISRIRWTSKKELVKYSVSTVAFMIFFGVFFYAIDLLVALLRSKI